MSRVVIAASCLLPALAAAEWNAGTELTSRYEYARNHDATPVYPVSGSQAYIEARWRSSMRWSNYHSLDTRLLVYANDSDLRGDGGLVLGNAAIEWQNGSTGLPWRLTVGDHFGRFSQRSLQQSLKGLALELQPGSQHSIQFLSGVAGQEYADLDVDQRRYDGVSWLYSPFQSTRLGFNWVRYRDEAAASVSRARLEQDTHSIFLDSRFPWAGQQMALQLEWARAEGSVDPLTPTLSARGDGRFAQLSGRRGVFDYHLRFEDNDRDFRPAGGLAAPDRRNREARVGYKFGQATLEARWQSLETERSTNRFSTRLVGARLGLPFGGTAIDAYRQTLSDAAASRDGVFDSVRISSGFALSADFSLAGGLVYQNNDDRISGRNMQNLELSLRANRRWQLAAGRATFAPGVVARRREDAGDRVDELGPSLGWHWSGRQHSLRMDYSWLSQDATGLPNSGSTNQSLRLHYAFESESHRLAVNVEHQYRSPDELPALAGSRLTLTYSYLPSSGHAAPGRPEPLVLAGLRIGDYYDMSAGRPEGDWRVRDERVFAAIGFRQRLAVRLRDERVEEIVVLIDLPPEADAASVSTSLSEVRARIMRQLGAADISRGDTPIDAGWRSAFARGELVRVHDWVGKRAILRVGLASIEPAGRPYIVVRLTRDELPSGSTGWFPGLVL